MEDYKKKVIDYLASLNKEELSSLLDGAVESVSKKNTESTSIAVKALNKSMEGQKDKTGKINGYTDLPWNALNEVTKRFQSFKIENGGKYSRDNHLNPMKDTDLLDAIFRHLIAYINGEDLDEKGGSHFTAIALNAFMLEELRLNGNLVDNRLVNTKKSDWYAIQNGYRCCRGRN